MFILTYNVNLNNRLITFTAQVLNSNKKNKKLLFKYKK